MPGSHLTIAAFFSLIVACSSNDDPAQAASASCPNDLPTVCAMPTPSYASTIVPLIGVHCTGCHPNYNQYEQLYDSRSAILDQVYACEMPPSTQAKLSAEERAALLGWLSCSAPQN